MFFPIAFIFLFFVAGICGEDNANQPKEEEEAEEPWYITMMRAAVKRGLEQGSAACRHKSTTTTATTTTKEKVPANEGLMSLLANLPSKTSGTAKK